MAKVTGCTGVLCSVGAVRHNGHVPFDNDVDICIPHADFEKFIKYGAKELPGDIFSKRKKLTFTGKYRVGPEY